MSGNIAGTPYARAQRLIKVATAHAKVVVDVGVAVGHGRVADSAVAAAAFTRLVTNGSTTSEPVLLQ